MSYFNRLLLSNSVAAPPDPADIFGDGSTRAYYDFDGNVNDGSGNGYDFNSTANFFPNYEPGRFGQSARWVKNIRLSKNVFSPTGIGLTDPSCSIWARISQVPADDSYIFGFNFSMRYRRRPAVLTSYGSLLIDTPSAIIPYNTWTHIVLNKVSNGIQVWYNGVLIYTVVTPAELRNRIWIAADTLAQGDIFWLDRSRLFTRSLSPNEIQQLYNET